LQLLDNLVTGGHPLKHRPFELHFCLLVFYHDHRVVGGLRVGVRLGLVGLGLLFALECLDFGDQVRKGLAHLLEARDVHILFGIEGEMIQEFVEIERI
jgi:hypothetical protein